MLAFHCGGGDLFNTNETLARGGFYSVSGIPDTRCDGVIPRIGAYPYSTYRGDFDARKIIPVSLKISLAGTSYDGSSRNGTVKVRITNTTSSAVIGTMYIVIYEADIAYTWQGVSTLYDVVRDMVPTNTGTAVTIPANSYIDKTENFSIDVTWDGADCGVAVFVQGSSKEIYQAAKYKW